MLKLGLSILKKDSEAFVEKLEIPLGEKEFQMVDQLLPGFLLPGKENGPVIHIQGKRLRMQLRTRGALVFEGVDVTPPEELLPRPKSRKPPG